MTSRARSFGGAARRMRPAAAFRRPLSWLRGLDKDLRLLVAIALIVAGMLAAGLATIREVERHLLKAAAIGAAVHWAEFLQAHLRGLDEILAAGLVAEDDQRVFDFAGAAGGVQDYQVIRPDGVVALSNWSGDFRGATELAILRRVVEQNSTVANVIEEDFARARAVIGQAYVPLTSGAGQRGALKVDVDVTGQAERYRRLGNGAFAALVALLLPPGGLAGWLVARNILAQRRSDRLQRERSRVLEALAKGAAVERILLRVACAAERNRPGSICTILVLDIAGETVAAAASPRRRVAVRRMVGQGLGTLPEPFAGSLRLAVATMDPGTPGGPAWSVPLHATSGSRIGSLVLQFPDGMPARPPNEDGPEAALAQLAALAVESRRAENAIAEMRQRNELILNAAADGIFGVDAGGRITFANPAAARLLGRTVEEMIGLEADEMLSAPDDGTPRECAVAAALGDGRPRHLEKIEIRGRGGDALTVQLIVTPIARQLSSLRAVVVFQDISAQVAAQKGLRRAKEEAEAASRSKSSFLAHMSHELRTPLNAIIGFSEVMVEQTLGPIEHPHYREYAEHIHASGQHLLSLINDLLDLSKIEAGKLELWEETTDLHELFDRCRIFVTELAQNKGVAVAVTLSPALPLLHCDARKLKQVLVNLLSNAVKFTPHGGQVVLEAESDGVAGVVLRVRDNGIGIAAGDLEKVMAPFGQASEAVNHENQGTGLGLPLSKALVELHGGTLELTSQRGEGTTVTVRLPGRALPPASLQAQSGGR